jgi:stage IV sporulation protein FB
MMSLPGLARNFNLIVCEATVVLLIHGLDFFCVSLSFDSIGTCMFGLEPTPFDVRLVAFRIPIRVHPSFWVVSILLSWNPDHLDLVFLWTLCLFVSILVHELGHALVAEALRWPSEIVLYWGGGLAFSQRYTQRTPWREMSVALAGPFAGFGLYGLIEVARMALIPEQVFIQNDYAWIVYLNMKYINLYWGLVNMLPVLPLDGGHVCRSVLELLRFRDPQRLATQISIPVAVGMAAWLFSINPDNRFPVMLFAMLCLQNVMSLQQRDRSPW